MSSWKMAWISALFLDLVLLSLLTLLGWLALRLVVPRASAEEKLGAAFPLGAGLLTFTVFLLSWAGLPIGLASLAAIYAVMIVILIAARQWLRASREEKVPNRAGVTTGRQSLLSWMPWAFVAALTVVAGVISIGRSYTPFDASAIWAAKGYGIAVEGTIFAARTWGAHSLSYPLNVPLLISTFQFVDGDILPGSKLLFPVFFACTLLGAIGFWRRLGASNGWLCAGALFLGTIPEIFRHATYGYVNIPAAAYLVLGTLWGVVGLTEGSRRHMVVAGVLLGLGSWTRVEGTLFAVVITVALAAAELLQRRSVAPVLVMAAPLAAIGGLWLIFYRIYGLAGSQAGDAMAAAFAGWRAGDLKWHSMRLILGYFRRELLDTGTWGLLFPVSAAFIAVCVRRLFDRATPSFLPLALATLVSGVATAGLFYVGSYARGDLIGWLGRGFPRAFFPAAFLLGILAFALAAGRSSPREAGGFPAEP